MTVQKFPFYNVTTSKIDEMAIYLKTLEIQGFLLKGTKNGQWEKAGTGQAKIRSSNG